MEIKVRNEGNTNINEIQSESQNKMQSEKSDVVRITESVKVSVIVPVYNSEKYLRQCLDSICAQTLQEIEIICVDDGSTDGSYAILKEYCGRDTRISIFQQENRTAGAARNLGKSLAKGEYMVFWDSDDYFDPHALEFMYEKAAVCQADICVCGASKYYQDWDKTVTHLQFYMNKNKIPKQEYFNMDSNRDDILLFTTAAPWNKMYRRDFICENQLDFQEVRNGNDVYFVICSLCLADRIVTIDQALITYRVHLQENLTGSTSKSPLTGIQAWEAAVETLEERKRFPERSFANRALKGIIYTLRNIRDYEPFRDAIAYLKDGTLDRLHIVPRTGDFYDTDWYNEFIRSVREDTPEQVMAYLAHITYMQQMEASTKKQLADRQLKKKNAQIKEQKSKLETAVTQLQKMEEEKRQGVSRIDELHEQIMEERKKNVGEKKSLERQLQEEQLQREREKTELEQQLKEERKQCTRDKEQLQKELKTNREKLHKTEEDLRKTRQSWSLRIGRMVTWLPRKIRDMHTRLSQNR